jgi:hypothetical protein
VKTKVINVWDAQAFGESPAGIALRWAVYSHCSCCGTDTSKALESRAFTEAEAERMFPGGYTGMDSWFSAAELRGTIFQA